MIYKSHSYQDFATDHILKNPASALFLDMGLGKTVATLTAIDKLMFDLCEVSKVLVIAPKRVAEQVWSAEIDKWDHLQHLRISKVLGTESQRKTALLRPADIYVINRENVSWLIAHLGGIGRFDMVVIDELSSFKSAKSVRFKALRTVRPMIKRIVGLTGTPVPNGLLDLWPQMYLLDMGARLGKTLTSYRDRYFTPGKRSGQIIYEYKLRPGDDILGADYYQKEIYEKIGDICISMKAEDYLDLPERIDRNIDLRLKVQKQYDDFERLQVLALENLDHITVANAAALTNKLLQFSNGAVYDPAGKWHAVHSEKLEALEEIVETSNGHPVLVFYSYVHDKERITSHLLKYQPAELTGPESIKAWNEKRVRVMLAHPASAGHGLNLQAGGNIIVWFGLPWSLELYQQAVKRLHRQGQSEVVLNHRLIAKNTMDERVLKILDAKASGQDALLDAVKAIIQKHRKPAAA